MNGRACEYVVILSCCIYGEVELIVAVKSRGRHPSRADLANPDVKAATNLSVGSYVTCRACLVKVLTSIPYKRETRLTKMNSRSKHLFLSRTDLQEHAQRIVVRQRSLHRPPACSSESTQAWSCCRSFHTRHPEPSSLYTPTFLQPSAHLLISER